MKKYFLALLVFFHFCSFAQPDENTIPDAPSPPRLVNDFTGILSAQEVATLESKLDQFNKQTSNQIAIVLVKSLGNYEVSDYSFKLGRKWGIGQENLRNGILILIKPKTDSERGQAFIATGKGLEGAIPDATCHEIVNNEMIPRFKQNDYYGGIDAAVNVLMSLAKGEYDFNTYSKKSNDNINFIVVIVIVIIMAILIFRRRKGYTINRGGYGGGFFPFFGGGMFGGGGGRDNDSGGGGFGGVGGGDFGGGGAGGSRKLNF